MPACCKGTEVSCTAAERCPTKKRTERENTPCRPHHIPASSSDMPLKAVPPCLVDLFQTKTNSILKTLLLSCTKYLSIQSLSLNFYTCQDKKSMHRNINNICRLTNPAKLEFMQQRVIMQKERQENR